MRENKATPAKELHDNQNMGLDAKLCARNAAGNREPEIGVSESGSRMRYRQNYQ